MNGHLAGNLRALKHGAGSKVARLPLTVLPRQLKRQEENARRFRRELESLIVAVRGEVTLRDALIVNEAVAGEVHAAICGHALRTKFDELSVADRIKASEGMVKGRQLRNRAFDRLQLDRTDADMLKSLYFDMDDESASDGSVQDATEDPNATGEPAVASDAVDANPSAF